MRSQLARLDQGARSGRVMGMRGQRNKRLFSAATARHLKQADHIVDAVKNAWDERYMRIPLALNAVRNN
jgi:hypothetical protein